MELSKNTLETILGSKVIEEGNTGPVEKGRRSRNQGPRTNMDLWRATYLEGTHFIGSV